MMYIFILTLASLLIAIPVHAQWSTNPDSNTVISKALGDQQLPTIISDGTMGAIIAWNDFRSGTNCDIYAQQVNALGMPQWNSNDVAISTAASYQFEPTVTSDGVGGAIIVWRDFRSGIYSDIYAQCINVSGVVQWDSNGVAISTAQGNQQLPTMVSDGEGGAIIAWRDSRDDFSAIYAQRINASGVVQWDSNGVPIATEHGNQHWHAMVSDGAGGAIITWQDFPFSSANIYAQRINALGIVQWTADGVAISTAPGDQINPTITCDSSGGAIIAWRDHRNGFADVYAQRINASGIVQWRADGVAISTAASNQLEPTITSDSAGGAIIAWRDFRSSDLYADIYVQRINASDVVQWDSNGVAISTAKNNQQLPIMVSDGAGGAIITWQDFRNNDGLISDTSDIYAQRINASGIVQWTADGVAISTEASDQFELTITSDGAGGAIIAWYDNRSGTSSDIYAQQVGANGMLGEITAIGGTQTHVSSFALDQNYPNPFNPTTTISYQLPTQSHVTLKVFDVLGREVATLVNEDKNVGRYEVELDGSKLTSGVYFYSLKTSDYRDTKKLLLIK